LFQSPGALETVVLRWINGLQGTWLTWESDDPPPSNDSKPLSTRGFRSFYDESTTSPGAHGNLDVSSRHFAVLLDFDAQSQQVTLQVEGESESATWAVQAGAEIWFSGWWGRLDQFTRGDRVWVWFATGAEKRPAAVALLADELSHQELYAPVTVKAVDLEPSDRPSMTLVAMQAGKPTERTVGLSQAFLQRGDSEAGIETLRAGEELYIQNSGENARLLLDSAAFERRRAAQQSALGKRWSEEGLPGTVILQHADRREVEIMLDHESMSLARSLQAGDRAFLSMEQPTPGIIRKIRPWHERTQILLEVEEIDAALVIPARARLRLARPLEAPGQVQSPTGLDQPRGKPERVEWLMASVYCTCGMHDACAGHFFTLAACNSSPDHPCPLAKRTREDIGDRIDEGQSDRQIFDDLLKARGANLLRPHMLP
jgi:hypothetical protein